MGFLFTVFYQPTANALFFLMDIFSISNIAFGILIFVFAVKLILLHNAIQNTRVQMKINIIAPKIKEIREKVEDKQQQMQQTLELYKKEGVNPLSPLLSLFIQAPILISMFFVIKGIGENTIPYDTVFYSFVEVSEALDFQFLSLSIMEGGGILIALLVGISQFAVMHYSQKSMSQDPAKKGQKRMFLIGIPILVTAFSFFMVAAVGVYWFFNNMVSVIQEIVVMQKVRESLKTEEEGLETEHPEG